MTDPAAPPKKPARRGGRPRLPDHMKRRGKISFTPTPDERAAIESRAIAAGLSVADYVRLAALGAPLRQYTQLAPEDRHALNRIGVNLNQIARHLNAGRPVHGPSIAEALAALLAFVEGARE